MLQALLVKTIINQVMKAVEKASDKRIARTHDKRIGELEKNSHPPMFTKKEYDKLIKRIEILEKRSKQ